SAGGARRGVTPMRASTVARWTIALCLLAAAAEAGLGCTSTAGVSPGDAAGFLFVVGPDLPLALFAWRQRGPPAVSWGLLVVAAALAAFGLAVFGWDSYRYHTEPPYRKVQRLAVLFVPLVQWAVVVPVGLALLVRRLSSPSERPEDEW